MTQKRDKKTGKFSTQYKRKDFLNSLKEDDFLSTDEVAQNVGCTQNLAYRRLKELEGEGAVRSKKVGSSLAWQLSTGKS